MAAPRKIFRIEETAAARHPGPGAQTRASFRYAQDLHAQDLHVQNLSAQDLSAQDLSAQDIHAQDLDVPVHDARHAEVMQALGALRATLTAARPRPTASAGSQGCVTTALQTAQLTRVVQELEAVAADTTLATQKILAAAEEIDQLANNLAAALKGKLEQGAAQDISDLIIRIFEACNFQDLSGQRIAKVRTTLKFLEHPSTPEQNADKSVPPRDDAAQLLHGPRLDGDTGHITQAEIDALFDN
jgi:hypothetical protein